MGGMCVQLKALRKQLTVTTGNILVVVVVVAVVVGHLSASATYLIATSEASTAVAMVTATPHKQHSHAHLNVCINPPLRSPAETHVLEFNCLPLSHFRSQIPKFYTFQTWYSLSLCHSFLCLGSPCHPNSNAKLQHNAYSTLHELI